MRYNARKTQDSGSVTYTVALGGDTNFRQTVARVETEEIRTWRVTIGAPILSNFALVVPGGFGANAALLPDINVQGAAPNPQGPTAHVTWANGGMQLQADLDWGRGCSFVVTGSQVEVAVNPLSIGGTVGGVIIFPAQIGPSDSLSPPAMPPTLTKRFGLLGAGVIGSVGIPDYARRVKLMRETSPTPAETCEITFQNGSGGQQYGFEQMTGGALVQNGHQWVRELDIPTTAIRMNYRNGPGAVGLVQPIAIFYLDLG